MAESFAPGPGSPVNQPAGGGRPYGTVSNEESNKPNHPPPTYSAEPPSYTDATELHGIKVLKHKLSGN